MERAYIVGCVVYAFLLNAALLVVIFRYRRLMPGLDWLLIILGFVFLVLFNATCIYLSWIEAYLGLWSKTAVTLLAIKATLFNIGFARHLKHSYEALEDPR